MGRGVNLFSEPVQGPSKVRFRPILAFDQLCLTSSCQRSIVNFKVGPKEKIPLSTYPLRVCSQEMRRLSWKTAEWGGPPTRVFFNIFPWWRTYVDFERSEVNCQLQGRTERKNPPKHIPIEGLLPRDETSILKNGRVRRSPHPFFIWPKKAYFDPERAPRTPQTPKETPKWCYFHPGELSQASQRVLKISFCGGRVSPRSASRGPGLVHYRRKPIFRTSNFSNFQNFQGW